MENREQLGGHTALRSLLCFFGFPFLGLPSHQFVIRQMFHLLFPPSKTDSLLRNHGQSEKRKKKILLTTVLSLNIANGNILVHFQHFFPTCAKVLPLQPLFGYHIYHTIELNCTLIWHILIILHSCLKKLHNNQCWEYLLNHFHIIGYSSFYFLTKKSL